MAEETQQTVPADQSPTPLDPANPPAAPITQTLGGVQASSVLVASAQTEQQDYTHDETVTGGLYVVEGQMVNAFGKPVNDKGQRINAQGKVMKPEEVIAEQYALMTQ